MTTRTPLLNFIKILSNKVITPYFVPKKKHKLMKKRQKTTKNYSHR